MVITIFIPLLNRKQRQPRSGPNNKRINTTSQNHTSEHSPLYSRVSASQIDQSTEEDYSDDFDSASSVAPSKSSIRSPRKATTKTANSTERKTHGKADNSSHDTATAANSDSVALKAEKHGNHGHHHHDKYHRERIIKTKDILHTKSCTGHACGCVPLLTSVLPGSGKSWSTTTPIAHQIVDTDTLESKANVKGLSKDVLGFSCRCLTAVIGVTLSRLVC